MATPTLDEYVKAYHKAMRAPLKQRTVFTSAGRTVVHSAGEKILYGPKGEKIRVIEDESYNTQIEHGDNLSGVARPGAIRIKMTPIQAAALVSGAARPAVINATMTPKGPR